MVKKREIKVTVTATGEVILEPINAVGAECLEWTDEIESRLGIVTQRTLKPSFHEDQTESDEVKYDPT